MKRTKISEESMAKAVVGYLCDLKWDVYQEVQIHAYDRRADIVAKQGSVIWVIECKTTLGLDVMEQAYDWIGYANMISVATPRTPSLFVEKILRGFGIGALMSTPGGIVYDGLGPRLFRKRSNALELRLSEEHKTFANAGTQHGFYTPWQQTRNMIVDFVRKNDGCLLRDAIEGVAHHYRSNASAMSSMSKWIRNGSVKGVVMRKDGRAVRLFLEGDGDGKPA